MAITYSIKKCPYCKKIINLSVKSGSFSESKLGQEESTICPKCHRSISNGKKEWQEMNSGEKTDEVIKYVFSSLILCITIAVFLGGLFICFVSDVSPVYGLIVAFFSFLLLASLCFIIKKKEIKSSKQRLREKIEETDTNPEVEKFGMNKESTHRIRCVNCGKMVDAELAYCNYCGCKI